MDTGSVTIAGAELADLEAILAGWLAPVAAYGPGTGSGPGALAAHALDLSLMVSAEMAATLSTGSRLTLREPEGAAIAALDVVRADPSGRVHGRIAPLEAPHHDEYPELWLSPTAVSGRIRAAGSRALAFMAHGAMSTTRWEEAAAAASRLEATFVVLLPSGGADLDGGLDLLRLRALHDGARQAVPAAVVVIVPNPFTDPWASPERLVLAARNAGVSHLAIDVRGRSHEEIARIESVALDAEVRLVPVELTDEPGNGHEGPPPALRVARGFTVFLTGLSGSGKSTIAKALRARLIEATGRPVSLLDGDLVRRHLSSELGFSREDRDVHVRRIGWVASQVTRHGGMAICAPIAPYEATRQSVRSMIEPYGDFVLVHVATPLEVCEARDRKGLYAKARAGLLANFTGISDPYETPGDAALRIDTAVTPVGEACALVIERLRAVGCLTGRT